MFQMNPNYHYYEDSIYSMDKWYAGFNLRQMKRINQSVGLNFENFIRSMVALDSKTSAEKEFKQILDSMIDDFIQIKASYFQFRPTNSLGEVKNKDSNSDFGIWVDKNYRRDRIKTKKELTRIVEFLITNGKNEITNLTLESIQNGASASFGSFLHWVHWYSYLLEGLAENGSNNNDGSDDFDLQPLANFLEKAEKLYKISVDIDYLKTEKYFSEVKDK